MAAPDNATFGTFIDGGDLEHGDIVVGLRDGLNTRFNFQGDPGLYLPLAGGTMEGAIDMDGNAITGLPSPTLPSDAVNKAYADALVSGEALTRVDDTNVTLTLGGTPLTALLHAVSLTLGWTGQLSVPRGGTGVASFTAYSVLCGGTTSTGALQNVSGLGSSGQVLVSNGAGALPSWQNVPGLTPAALTRVDDTNVTLTLGGTPATSLLQAVSLTLGWTGTLSGTRGGTGVNNGANTATFAGNLNFAAAFTTSGAFAVTQTYTGVTNVTFPTSGTLATVSQIPTGAALTRVDDTNVTLTLGGSPATALVNAASLTLGWTGQLAVSRGGTGAGTLTGLLTGNGTSAITGTAITQYNVLTGGASNLPNSVAPSATSGVPLISQGSSSQPVFGTAVVAGGGTGNTTFTAYSVICAGTTATGAFQNVSGLGSSGQVLTSNGAGLLPTWQSTTVTNAINQIATQTFTTTGADTYTPNADMVFAIIELQGAGGGSGGTTGTAGQSALSGSGGGGAYMRLLATAAQIGASATLNIGAAGAAGTSGNNAGGAGGNTTITISGSTWTAGGGGGGGGRASSASAQSSGTAGTAGANTTGSNATLIVNIPGQSGSSGFSNGNTVTNIILNEGGSGFLGRGGSAPAGGANAGVNYGGGSSGYYNGAGANHAGELGAQGVIIITEFLSV